MKLQKQKEKMMNRILTFLIAALLVVGMANSAAAEAITSSNDGIFIAGLKSAYSEMGVNLGLCDTDDGTITETTVTDLFDATDVGSYFDGADNLADIRIGGLAVEKTQIGRDYHNYEVWFAVQEGYDVDDFNTVFASFDTVNTLYNYTGTQLLKDADYYLGDASSYSMGYLLNGTVAAFISEEIGTTTLDGLTVDSMICMDIFHFNNYGTLAEDDDTVEKTSYQMQFGIGENNMVYSQVAAVPVPGALILLGSGLLGIIGLRSRRSAA